MFLPLTHTKFDVYNAAGDLLMECYTLASTFPIEERYNLTSQIKRAALSVKLNIAEGASRKSTAERKRFYEIARSSVVELDTAFDVAIKLNYLTISRAEQLGILLNRCYAMLSKMTGKSA
jgi:four helix bundle protein